jgi:hypothetical protein
MHEQHERLTIRCVSQAIRVEDPSSASHVHAIGYQPFWGTIDFSS